MTNTCAIDSVETEQEGLGDSPTPRTLKEAIALWECLRDRNQRIRERFQSLHPRGVLLRSATLQPTGVGN
jgi:hypothetical protein